MVKLSPPNHQSKSAKSSSICHQNSLCSPNWTAKVTLRNSVCIVYHLPAPIQAVRENFLNERTKCIHPSSICLNVTLHSTNGSTGFQYYQTSWRRVPLLSAGTHDTESRRRMG